MITSTQNSKVKEIRGLQSQAKKRRETGSFVVEGVRLIEEAYKAGWPLKMLLYSENLNQRGFELVTEIQEAGNHVELASPHVMESISDTKNPQGILAILSNQSITLPNVLDFVLILDQIRDPGNLGSLLRTASAAGTQAVFILPGTTDVFSPKVLRSGMGAHFQIPILQGNSEDFQTLCEKHGLQLLVAESEGGEIYTNSDLKKPIALIIGGEANGISDEVKALQPKTLRIPMPGKSESLNAAIAGAILLFEVVRQRDSI